MSSHPVLFFMKPFLLDFWLHYKRVDHNPPSFELTANLQFRHPSEKPPFYHGPILPRPDLMMTAIEKESPVDLLSFFISRKQTRESKEATAGILSSAADRNSLFLNKSKMKAKKIEIRLPGAFLFPFLRECFFYCQGVWLNGGKKLIKLSFDCLYYIGFMCEEHG